MWREDSHHDRWLGDMHRRSHNYSQYLKATDVGLVHRSGEKTPTMSGGSVMCIVDRTIIRNIWKLRMGLCSMQERASREGVRMPITQSGWATVKLGIDLGGVLSKAPELAKLFLYWTRTGILFSHFDPISLSCLV